MNKRQQAEVPNPLLIYLSGLFDGLGTVKIETPKKGMRPCLYAWVTSKHFSIMEELQKLGAHITHRPDGLYRARWKENNAYRILQSIKSFLKVKKEQAICGVEFWENKRSGATEDNDVVFRLRLRLLKASEENINEK